MLKRNTNCPDRKFCSEGDSTEKSPMKANYVRLSVKLKLGNFVEVILKAFM